MLNHNPFVMMRDDPRPEYNDQACAATAPSFLVHFTQAYLSIGHLLFHIHYHHHHYCYNPQIQRWEMNCFLTPHHSTG